MAMSLPRALAALVAVFALTSALALALGAADLGTALGIGQLFFAVAAVGAMLRW